MCTNSLPQYSNLLELANNFKDFFINKIKSINDSFDGVPVPIINYTTEQQDDTFSSFENLNSDDMWTIIREINKTHCLNDPFDVSKLPFDEISGTLAVIFVDIINCSFNTGVFPSSEKFAIVRPKIKGNKDPDNLSSFRPLYNTSFLNKALESAALEQLK